MTNSTYPATPIRIDGRRTSMRLSPVELVALDRICAAEEVSRDDFCTAAWKTPQLTGRGPTMKVRSAITDYLLSKWLQQPGREKVVPLQPIVLNSLRR